MKLIDKTLYELESMKERLTEMESVVLVESWEW